MPAEFGKLIADEIEKWAKLIKFAVLKPGHFRPCVAGLKIPFPRKQRRK
jgi:hypothetical protein